MPLRLYMDMDSLRPAVIRGLRANGTDVLTSAEAGHQRLSDERQLEFATAEGRAIYTANLVDFTRLHAAWMRAGRHHHGIIVRINQQLSVGDQIRALGHIGSAMPAGLEDVLVYLENW
ncbi:MAG: hypothetical protein C0506_02640 [Anaerolinea sp.]|nr:hypothetical protein [Anaerolinea sp.]